jgi:hypothetical protein
MIRLVLSYSLFFNYLLVCLSRINVHFVVVIPPAYPYGVTGNRAFLLGFKGNAVSMRCLHVGMAKHLFGILSTNITGYLFN